MSQHPPPPRCCLSAGGAWAPVDPRSQKVTPEGNLAALPGHGGTLKGCHPPAGASELQRPLPAPSDPLQAQSTGKGRAPFPKGRLGDAAAPQAPTPTTPHQNFRMSRTSRVCEPACPLLALFLTLLGRAKGPKGFHL